MRNLNYRHRAGLCTGQKRSGVQLIQSRADSKTKMVRGYAAVYYDPADEEGSQYWLWSDTVERIAPGAFDRAIKEMHDARGLFNHDANQLLGRVSNGTCRISTDAKGLIYEIDQDETDPDWQRVAAKIDRGDVTGSSFAFAVTRATWTETPNYWIRTIEDVDLFDVCPVTWPAYTGTSAGRSVRGGGSIPVRDWSGSECDELRAELLRERNAYMGDDSIAIRARLIEIGE